VDHRQSLLDAGFILGSTNSALFRRLRTFSWAIIGASELNWALPPVCRHENACLSRTNRLVRDAFDGLPDLGRQRRKLVID